MTKKREDIHKMKVNSFRKICEELTENYERKNRDYGDSFSKTFEKFGLVSPLTRLNDKVNRLNSLVYKETEVKDEKVNDTLKDLASYAIMTLVNRKLKE